MINSVQVKKISVEKQFLIPIYPMQTVPEDKFILVQGDQKKHPNWLFLGEIIQPNLPKFLYNLIRGRRARI